MSNKIINKIFDLINVNPEKIDTIVTISGLSRKSISQSVGKLINHGYVVRSETGVYRLSEKGKSLKRSGKELIIKPGPQKGTLPTTICQNTFRSRAWKLMKLQRKFSVNDLLTLAKNGNEKQPLNSLHIFIKALVRTGYIMELPSREDGYSVNSNGFKRYLLLKDTGNKAPVVRRKEFQVYDPNNGEVISWKKA